MTGIPAPLRQRSECLFPCAVFKVRVRRAAPDISDPPGLLPANPQNDTDKRFSQIYQLVLRLRSTSARFPFPSIVFRLPLPAIFTCFRKRSTYGFKPRLSAWLSLPRKEVIQPHLPIRLPCYDFTPVSGLTFGSWLLAVTSLTSGAPNSHGVTGGVYKARERIHRGMLIRDY